MAYSFQTFGYLQVFTSVQANQIEENILKHEHGVTTNCQTLTLYATLSENETITGQWKFTGSVGMGTDPVSPRKLHISGTLDANYLVTMENLSTVGGYVLQLHNNNDSFDTIRISNAAGSLNTIRLFGSGNAEFAGNVGIGTSPSFGLHVVKSADGVPIALIRNQSSSGFGVVLQNGLDSNYSLEVRDSIGVAKAHLYGNGNADFAGNVGIGKDDPAHKLHIQHTTGADRNLFMASVLSFSNGFSIDYINSPQKMVYTFANGQIVSTLADGTKPLDVTSTTVCTNLNADMVDGLHTTVIQIGDWDMDTTTGVSISHGLTLSKIRSISVIVYADAGIAIYDFNGANGESNTVVADATTVGLDRLTGGVFDSISFNQTSFNRGWITIQHVP